MQQRMASYTPGNTAHKPTGADVKWRYFWRLRSKDSDAGPPQQVVPANFPAWAKVMDGWGHSLLRTAETVSTLLAVAYDLPEDTFTRRMTNGDHLLAPTGVLYVRFSAAQHVSLDHKCPSERLSCRE